MNSYFENSQNIRLNNAFYSDSSKESKQHIQTHRKKLTISFKKTVVIFDQ